MVFLYTIVFLYIQEWEQLPAKILFQVNGGYVMVYGGKKNTQHVGGF